MAVFTGNGSAASPSFTFSSDTNTGLYRTASDELGISIGGNQKANFTGSGVTFPGNAGFEVSLTTGSSARLTVANQISGANTAITLSNNNAGSTDGYGSHLEWSNQGTISRISALRTGVGAANKFVFRLTDLNNTAADRLLLDANYLRLLSGTGGIQFNGDTAAANALDDYEEGTFSPVPTNFTSPLLLPSRYTKVGELVTIYFYWVISSANAPYTYDPADVVEFTGLPYITNTGSDIHGVVVNLGSQNNTWAAFGSAGSGHREFFAFGERGGASIRLFDKSTGAAVTYGDLWLPTSFGAGPGVRGTFTYRAS